MDLPQHMDPDDFVGTHDVSISEGNAPGEVRLTFATADEKHSVTATKTQLLNLAKFISETLGNAPPDA